MKQSYIVPQLKYSFLKATDALADLVVNGSGEGTYYNPYIDGLQPED